MPTGSSRSRAAGFDSQSHCAIWRPLIITLPILAFSVSDQIVPKKAVSSVKAHLVKLV